VEQGKHWKIPTSFGNVILRLRTPSVAAPPRDNAAQQRGQQARFHLLFELRVNLGQASSALREVWQMFEGNAAELRERERAPSEDELAAFERMLDAEISGKRIELDLEPFHESLREHERDTPLPPLRALPEAEQETSFIAANLLDQDGKPVVGRRWLIELPDGSKHEGRTDAEGWARVRGFKKDGTAKISFPDFDELDFKSKISAERVIEVVEGEEPEEEDAEVPAPESEDAAAESEAAPESKPVEKPSLPSDVLAAAAALELPTDFVEFTLIDEKGVPAAGIKYRVTTEDDQVFEGQADDTGFVRIDGFSGKTCQLELSRSEEART